MAFSNQDAESFLFEVMVVAEDFSDALVAHGDHRDAISQTIFLVRALFVKIKPA
jgi:hypothetical protein